MDPALQELLRHGAEDETLTAIIRLAPGQEAPAHLRVVSRFGDVATVRVRRGDVAEAYASDAIASFKATRWLMPEPDGNEEQADVLRATASDQRRRAGWPTGRGCVVAALDWGLDFTHPDFRNADGSTRLLGLWDQSAPYTAAHANTYGYGRFFTRAQIDAALRQSNPFAALGYDPRRSDRGSGTHGTHVMGIAAGNGRSGGPDGMAPDAQLLFVHMGTSAGRAGPRPLTDSAAVLEALDYVNRQAGAAPTCINMSMGTHGGPHDGSTLVERGIDAFITTQRGRIVVQSTGNYFERRAHASGRLAAGERVALPIVIDANDITPNDIEVWYAGSDELMAAIESPDGRVLARAGLGQTATVMDGGTEIGRLYHRRRDPNNGDHQIQVNLDAPAAVGQWALVLRARRSVDGRFHSWIERDTRCAPCQATFSASHAVQLNTTGSICNGRESIVVGAYDASQAATPLGHFSSSGPTRDGRGKPDLLAPGVRVLSARSTSRNASAPLLTRMSGTSMAAPHVTGTAALLCELAGRALTTSEVCALLRRTCDPATPATPLDAQRIGAGRLNTDSALHALRAAAASPHAATTRETAMETTPLHPSEQNAALPLAEGTGLDAEATEFDERNRRRSRYYGPSIVPVIGAGGVGAAVMAPLGGTAIIAPIGGMGAPTAPANTSPQVVVNNGAPTTAAAGSAPCACTTSGGDVAVASAEPTVAAEQSVFAESGEAWRIAPEDMEAADKSVYAEHAFRESEWAADEYDDAERLHSAPVEFDELAEASISDNPTQAPSQLVRDVLARAGWSESGDEAFGLRDALASTAVAARLFDHFVGRRQVLPAGLVQRFALLARPGGRAQGFRPGDWLLRRGEGGIAHVAVIATPVLWPAARLLEQGWQLENSRTGGFVHVIDPAQGGRLRHDRFARRLCDSAQRLLPDTLVLRPLRPGQTFHAESDWGETVDVRWVQQALNQILGLSLAVDGAMGPQTRGAVRAFQTQQGLVVDGVVGPRTETALRNALQGRGAAPSPVRGGNAACTTLDSFEQGRADLTPTHHALIIGLARRIQREGIREVQIAGFASSEGDEASNLALGQRRAASVGQGLIETLDRMRPGSSAAVSISITSRGEGDQIPGASREQNRRVDVCLRARVRPRPPVPVPPQPQPPVVPTPPQAQTRVFRVTGKSFINVVGSRTGSLDCGVEIGPIRIPGASNLGLRALAAATDLAFSEDPRSDLRFVAPPPESKGYRLFSQGSVHADFQGTDLLSLRLSGGLATDAGKECVPGTGACLQAPPLIVDQPFSTRRIGPSSIAFRWGVKGRPPAAAEPAFDAICLRTSVFIWHEVVGVVDVSSGQPRITSIFIQGSRFPSHRAWVDGTEVHHVRQGPMSNLWDASPSDPTRVR